MTVTVLFGLFTSAKYTTLIGQLLNLQNGQKFPYFSIITFQFLRLIRKLSDRCLLHVQISSNIPDDVGLVSDQFVSLVFLM